MSPKQIIKRLETLKKKLETETRKSKNELLKKEIDIIERSLEVQAQLKDLYDLRKTHPRIGNIGCLGEPYVPRVLPELSQETLNEERATCETIENEESQKNWKVTIQTTQIRTYSCGCCEYEEEVEEVKFFETWESVVEFITKTNFNTCFIESL